MDHEKKLSFLQNMTHMALTHAASVPNVPTPTGGMSHDKMLSFVSQIAEKGLKHFDIGGSVVNGPTVVAPGSAPTTTGGFSGGVGNFLGTTNKFQATATPVQAGTTGHQLNNAYAGVQNALDKQNKVAGTLNTGLTQGADTQQQLAQMYLQQAQGQGPNPALAQLNQQTGNNIAQQAALAAGTRGAGANAGLIARQNAQQGAATQQQAVGQGATMQAQQQLAAEGNLQNLAANQIAQGTGATQVLNNAVQGEQGILQGANTAFNNANVSQQSNLNNVNASIATANQNNSSNMLSDIGSGVSAVLGFLNEGGEVKKDLAQVEHMPWVKAYKMMADGGQITGQATSGPQSYVGQWLNSSPMESGGPNVERASINTNIADPLSGVKKSSGSKKDPEDNSTLTEAFTNVANPELDTNNVGGGWGVSNLAVDPTNITAPLMKAGGKVMAAAQSEKAVKKGDSLANDKVPAMLSEGEIVIPRHITMGPDPAKNAALFVAKELAKRGKKK